LIYKKHARSHGLFDGLLQNITKTISKAKWLKSCQNHGFGDVEKGEVFEKIK